MLSCKIRGSAFSAQAVPVVWGLIFLSFSNPVFMGFFQPFFSDYSCTRFPFLSSLKLFEEINRSYMNSSMRSVIVSIVMKIFLICLIHSSQLIVCMVLYGL